jgi:hypothetical protein
VTEEPKKPTLVPPPEETVVPLDRDQRLIEKIEKLMATRLDGSPSVVLDYTPGACRMIIERWRGTHNRNVKTGQRDKYAKAMTEGGFVLNGDTIKFTDQRLLGDGQNRLLACIRSGVPFKSHTVFGIPHQHFKTMDQGRVRNGGDMLTIAGVEHGDLMKSALRWCELLATNPKRRTTFENAFYLILYNDHHGVEDWQKEARAIYRLNRQPLGLVMAVLHTANKVDSDFTVDYASAWATGTYEPRFAVIGTMQTAIEKIIRLSNGRVNEVVRAAMVVNSWNAARAGRKGPISWDLNRPFPTFK